MSLKTATTKLSILFTLAFVLTAAVAVLWQTNADAQGKKENPVEKKIPLTNEKSQAAKATVTIHEVVKEDARAKSVAAGRVIPVRFVWLCGSTGNAKLVTLEARLITLNTDGKQTTVSKKLVDWKVNVPITSVIDLPMANDVFAKNFTLELVGKFTDGKTEQVVSTSKQGSFPVPNPIAKK